MRTAAPIRTLEGTENYLSSFTRLEERLNGQRYSPLHDLRKAAIRRFSELGFPTTRHEEWRFTNVTRLAKIPFRLAEEEVQPDPTEVKAFVRMVRGEAAGPLLVFVNGQFSSQFSTGVVATEAVQIKNLADAWREHPESVEKHLARIARFDDSTFTALNTAFLGDGAYVRLGRGRSLETPLTILHLTVPNGEPTVAFPRTLIVAEEHSRGTVTECFASLGNSPALTVAVTEIAVSAGADLDHYRVQRDTITGNHLGTLQVNLDRSSRFASHSFCLGGALVRNDAGAALRGEGGECTLNGLYLGSGQQVVDNHTAIEHAMPHCASHEVYHGVLDQKAAGVFNGKIFVRQDAQKTDAKQTNRTLLLSDDAVIDTKPQLEIFADDVRCTHGATVGHLDENALFYLRTRGIPREQAAGLLTYAFANEIVERVQVKALRDGLENAVFAWLREAHVSEAV